MIINYYDYLDKLKLDLKKARKNIYISCFTKRFDSTLMWAHYANQFNGVCIEWDIIRSSDNDSLVDVKYSKKKSIKYKTKQKKIDLLDNERRMNINYRSNELFR